MLSRLAAMAMKPMSDAEFEDILPDLVAFDNDTLQGMKTEGRLTTEQLLRVLWERKLTAKPAPPRMSAYRIPDDPHEDHEFSDPRLASRMRPEAKGAKGKNQPSTALPYYVRSPDFALTGKCTTLYPGKGGRRAPSVSSTQRGKASPKGGDVPHRQVVIAPPEPSMLLLFRGHFHYYQTLMNFW